MRPDPAIEERIRAAVAEQLEIEPDRVDVTRSLISLGFDSLMAVNLRYRIQTTLGLSVSVADLLAGFSTRQVAESASPVDVDKSTDRPALVRRGRPRQLPLSFAQQRLWFLDQLTPGSHAYTVAGAVRFTGRLRLTTLAATLTDIVARHEALRTVFPTADGKPYQRILPAEPVPLPMTDLSGIPVARATAQARMVAQRHVERPFDLVAGPLLRARLVRLSDTVHELIVAVHHIACDGVSMAAMLGELATIYQRHIDEVPDELPELAVQYADYTQWQQDWLTGAEHERQLAYWRRTLAGAPPALNLATDHPRPSGPSVAGAVHHQTLPPELTDPLHTLARDGDATLFMTLAAAFAALLARLSGQTDVVVGTPIANRADPALEPLIGFFVNTLAIRTDLAGDPTFRQLLTRTRQSTLDAYQHQDLPFEHLVDALGLDRDLRRNPLFQAMFTLQNVALSRFRLPDGDGGQLQAVPRELSSGAAKFDLTLTILHDDDDNLRTRWEYRSDLFEEASIARIAGYYQTLLERIVAEPDRPLSTLMLLTLEQRHQQVHLWNASLNAADPTCAQDLIAITAAAAPDAVALVAGDRRIDYAELIGRADALAGHLRRLGVGPDVLVGLSAQRGPELVIGLLAILRAGGAYLPLDPTYPSARLAQLLADADPPIILVQHHLRGELPEHGARQVVLEDPVPPGPAAPPVASDPRHLAYVLYTSGSTGRPKGVAITHANLTGFLAAMDELFGRRPQTWLALTSTAFDISVLELIWTLSAGHRVVLLDETATDVAAAIDRHGVTHLQATPSFASRLLTDATPAMSTLDTLMLGGEAFSPTLVDQLRKLPGTTVINGYGPTEASVYATAHVVAKDEEEVPIGRPVAGARAYILDRHGEPVPVGVTGELFLAGHGIARGYLNRPALTAERFLPNPHGLPGSRMYRTGDLARYRADGTIEFLGRTDHQVKVRGYRIELDEIDAVLTRHPAVRDAVTVARDDQLVSYVVGPDPTELAELRGRLRHSLPAWMHPAHLIPLAALPLTPNNKVDRRRLPAPPDGPVETAPVEPATATQRLVAGIWATILRRTDIGPHDNFFELGGHSLLATQAVAHIRRACRIELPLRSIFERPTIAGLSELVERETTGELRPELSAGDRPDHVPPSFAQQRLWFLEQLAPDTVYAIAGTVSLAGTLDVGALNAALSAIVARHEALRTVFGVADGQPYQLVLPPAEVPLPVTDLTGRAESEVRALAGAEAVAPFDLTTGPLLRARLVRRSARRHELIVVVHHIACDGWSLNVMLDELTTLYQGRTPPELTVQYADYALWQRDWLQGAELNRQLDYWRDRLAGAPPALELPADRPRPAIPGYTGGTHRQEVPARLAGAVRELARAGDATLFMALYAAFATLLWRLSGQDDVVVGTPVAGRAEPELEPLIGFFVNTVALRTDLSDDPTFTGLLARTRDTTLAAYQHQDLPFEYLVERLRLVRDLGRNPLFQVMFTVAHNALPVRTLPGLELRTGEVDTGVAKFDLTLTLSDLPDGGLLARWEYSRDLFDEPTVARLARYYRTLLENIVAAPDRPLSTLRLLTEEERQNHIDQPLPKQDTVLVTDQIATRASARPGGTALLSEGVALTYAELTGRADALAARLRDRGVGPDVLVGLCARRGPELIVGLLAILRAGGAYLPLDPGYPAARLQQILADARPALLLTEAALREDLPACQGIETVLLDEPVPPLTAPLPPAPLHPHHLAYVIYTSGSTGTPKGVAVSHANLAASTAARNRVYDRTVRGFVLLSSVAFDTSVASIFWSLTRGATLHLPSDGRQLELDHLAELLRRKDVSHLICLPSLYRLLVERLGDGPCSLETVVVAGEPVPPALVDLHHDLLPEVPLYNEYGPTEATVWSTVSRCEPGESRVPIGRAIPGWQVYVVDIHGEPVPAGVTGELCLSGHGIVRGYLDRPGLTAERFLPNPHGEPGSRLYRTGDLARFRADGQIEFLGRTDHQVKVRGYRIELDEIDAVLTRHPAVRAAVTVAGGDQLVSYVVGSGSVAELREYLRAQLPAWMRPGHLVPLDALPLTPNNKVDRDRLPAPRPADRAVAGFQAPVTPVEQRVAQVWQTLLHVDAVGLDENFFDLGGHSLLLVQAHQRLTELDPRLRIVDLFRYPTVRTLAAHLTGESNGNGDADDDGHRQRRAGRQRQEERRRRLRGSEQRS